MTFEQKYSAIYRKIFDFHKKHCNADTESDWNTLAKELNQFTDKFEIDLSEAVASEIERLYHERNKTNENK